MNEIIEAGDTVRRINEDFDEHKVGMEFICSAISGDYLSVKNENLRYDARNYELVSKSPMNKHRKTLEAIAHGLEHGADSVECTLNDAPTFQVPVGFKLRDLLNGELKIRIKEKRKPIISDDLWEVLPEWITCIEWNANGVPMGLDRSPALKWHSLVDFKGLNLNGCDWKDSLVMRPEHLK